MEHSHEKRNAIAQHYNARPDVGFQERKKSPIIQMKGFNNWVKSILIGREDVVLDLAGGKGGDFLKWKKAKISYLKDVASKSVQDAVRRYNDLKDAPFAAEFVVADCWKKGFLDHLTKKDLLFDVVSCQFALHYSFETEEKARACLYNVSSRLKAGGRFIGTIPNSYWLVKKLRSIEGLKFGNSVYEVEFAQKEHFPPFGAEYLFTLEDAVDRCPEFLVHFETFKRLAEEHDLELELHEGFHQFYQREYFENRQSKELLDRMLRGSLDEEQWEATGIYCAFVFRKKGNSSPSPIHDKPHKVDPRDIIVVE